MISRALKYLLPLLLALGLIGAGAGLWELENPACRWSDYDCLAMPLGERPAMCDDPELPWQIQERAWTSPIWYQPQ